MAKPYNASDPDDVAAQELFLRLKAKASKAALQKVMGSEHGRHVIFDILALCQYHDVCFENSAEIYRHAGKRHVAKQLIELIFDDDENAYVKMEWEGRNRTRRQLRDLYEPPAEGADEDQDDETSNEESDA